MKAIKLLGNKELEIIEVKKPQITGGYALVKVMASSICRTDIDLLYEMPHLIDMIPGHEVAGIVEEINSPGDFKKGDRVRVSFDFD